MGLPVDGRSDLFSAGVILYQFLTGERPFSGSADDDDAEGAEGRSAAAVVAQHPGAAGDGRRRAQGARQERRRALPDGAGIRRRDRRRGVDDELARGRRARGQHRCDDHRAARRRRRRCGRLHLRAAPQLLLRQVRRLRRRRRSPAAAPPSRGAQSGDGRRDRRRRRSPSAPARWFAYQRYRRRRRTHRAGTDAAARRWRKSRRLLPPAPAAAGSRHPQADPGTLKISAVGLVDPSDPRYNGDKALQQNDARADAKSQIVDKALGLLLDTKSLDKNYDLLKDKLLANSGNYIKTVVHESEPRVGKDGLMSVTTEAVVNVKALQKSLNQMSRDERVEMIRASGDPKVSVQIDHPRRRAAGGAAADLAGRREHPEGAHQVVRLPHLGRRRRRRQPARRLRRAWRSEDQEAVHPARGVGPAGDEIHAHVVDGEVRRSCDRRGDLLQHDAAEGRGQLGERGRGAEGDRRRRSPTNSRATSSCSTATWRARRSR